MTGLFHLGASLPLVIGSEKADLVMADSGLGVGALDRQGAE